MTLAIALVLAVVTSATAAGPSLGVVVYGLSVDKSRTEVLEFFEGASLPDYRLGLLSPKGTNILEISGIPTVFVVDADGRVVTVIRGFWRDDTRLEDALESLLASPAATSSRQARDAIAH